MQLAAKEDLNNARSAMLIAIRLGVFFAVFSLIAFLPSWAVGKGDLSSTSSASVQSSTNQAPLKKTRAEWRKVSASALAACKQFDATRNRLKKKMLRHATKDNPPDEGAATEALQAEWENLHAEEKIQAATDLAQELIEAGDPPIPLMKKLEAIKLACEGKPYIKVDDRVHYLR